MQKYINNVAVKNGARVLTPLVGGLVTVTTIAGAAATLYDANGGLPRTTPLLTDINGAFSFYAPDGRYTITITGAGIVPITISDVLLEDPVDGAFVIVDGAIVEAKIGAGAVTTAKIIDGAVTTLKLSDNAVTTAKINASAVTTAKLADDAVTNAKVSAGAAIDSGKLSVRADGAGWVARSVKEKLLDIINVKDHGVLCDNTTDDTAAIQALINKVGTAPAFDGIAPAIVINFPFKAKCYIAGTLYLPSFVRIELNGATLRGTGGNVGFESAYFVSGVSVTNFGQANETQFVVGSSVRNGNLLNFNRAFRLFNFCEDSDLHGLRFIGCNQAVYAKRCFYSSYTKILARSPLDGLAFPAFHFDDAVNAITLQSVFAVSYNIGWNFSGGKDSVTINNCGAESCPTGMKFNGSTFAVHVLGCYFEYTFNALDFVADGNHENVYVSGCFFNATTNAIQGSTIVSGEFSQRNKLNGAAISVGANFTNRVKVSIPATVAVGNDTPNLPVGYAVGDACNVDFVKSIYDSTTGLISSKSRVYGGKIPFDVAGDSGNAIVGQIPFCTSVLTATTLTVDTKINFRDGAMLGVHLAITDGGAQVVNSIFIGGSNMATVKPAPLTIAVSNNAGFFRFTVTGLAAASAFSGVIRHL